MCLAIALFRGKYIFMKPTVSNFFIQNLDVVHFFYGLAFFVLGISIIAQLRATQRSRYKLVDILWLLAAFGLIHGTHEFIEISILERHVLYLEVVNVFTVGTSYIMLFFFGYDLVNISVKTGRLGIWFPVFIASLFFALPLIIDPTSPVVWTMSSRYFLGFVGAILSAIGLLLYYRSESDRLAKTSVRGYFILAAAAFVLYGLSAGLVGSRADFVPASLINVESFTAWFGFPPQLLRALAAVGIAASIWQIVNIFNLEQAAERDKAEAKLRRAHDELEIRVEERTEQLAKSKELSDALNRINAAINSTLDFDKIMQTVVNESGQAIGAETVVIFLHENSDWVVKYVYGPLAPLMGTRFTPEEAKGAVIAATSRKPFVSNDAYNDPRLNANMTRKHNVRAMLILPLIVRGDVAGALYFTYHTAPVAFTDAQVDFAGKLAVSVSLAFENARLYESEHYIAETLQETLLTMPTELPDIDFSHKYQSATETAKVGGDFYDIFELEHQKIGIIIGDVSGKGVQASTLTSVVKNTIKAHAYDTPRLASAVSKTNEVIVRTASPGLFVTVFFGVLDTESGAFSYCNAGHPQPILKRKKGPALFLPVGSPAIGVSKDFEFIEGEETLNKGDLLVAYTDGVTEARHDAELFGEKRLLDLVESLDVGAKEITPRIFSEIIEFSGGKLTDDIALLALSIK